MSKPTTDYYTCRNSVVQALVELPSGQALAEALLAEQNFIHWISPEQVSGITTIAVQEGDGPQALTAEPIETQFQTYLETVIQPQIRLGTLTDGTQPGTYDDRKVRWAGSGVCGFWNRQGKTLTLAVGPTSYPHCQRDINRSPLETLQLMQRGLSAYQDPYAYFARGIGVAVIPLTSTGHVYLGQRSQVASYQGALNCVAGWATFSATVGEIDFYHDAQRELWEEVHIDLPLDNTNTQFIGISGNPMTGEADLVFVTQTEVPDQHFLAGQWPEHSCWFGIHNQAEAIALLEYGQLPGQTEPSSLMFSARLGLEYLITNHW